MEKDMMYTYLRLIKERAEQFRDSYETYYNECINHFEDGCRCDDFAFYAYMEMAIYKRTKDKLHAKYAVKALSDMGRLSDLYHEKVKDQEQGNKKATYTVRQAVLTSGRPKDAPMEQMFCPTYFLMSYYELNKENLFTEEERDYCKKAALRSIVPLSEYTDWGPQNRGMIKGTNLLLAGHCFPEDEKADERKKLGKILCSQSLGKWSIEDAQVYIPIWLSEIILYNEVFGSDEYYKKPTVYFYFDYIRNLMAPNGMIPEFGDGRFLNSLEAFIFCLEKGAAVYRDGKMRYAASKLLNYLFTLQQEYDTNLGNVAFLASALIWCDESVTQEKYTFESGEILDDIIGKKYRLCNDCEKDSRYLFFNYRDEGDYAYLAREYMRNTIVVENEKMHHGHSDENSIALLMAEDSLLLRDGGYREMDQISEDFLPGTYRSDFYHNKMLVRNGCIPADVNFIDFCSAEEVYNPVRTEKIFVETFDYCDAARTRVYDEKHQVDCDRTIVYLKKEGIYLVLDSVTARKDGDYTFGPVFYGEEITGSKGNYFSRNYENACDQPLVKHYKNPQNYMLNIVFPEQSFQFGQRTLRRNYHKETGLFQTYSGFMKKDQTIHMVTLLNPVRVQSDAQDIKVKHILGSSNGISVELETREGIHTFAFKDRTNNGYEKGIRKPNYIFENTAVRYKDLYTDALFTHLFEESNSESVAYELIHFTRAEYKNKLLWQVPHSSLIQGDWSLAEGISLWNKWFGTTDLK